MSEVLTPRQTEFLTLASRGLTRPDIAHKCAVSVWTVKSTLDDARERLGASTVAQAVALAVSQELIAV